MCFTLLLTIHPLSHADAHHVGRVDPSLLSQQTRMELFLNDYAHMAMFRDDCGDFLDVSAWVGAKVSESGEVIAIRWLDIFLRIGSLALDWLPATVQKLYIRDDLLTGTLNTAQLPENLITLEIICTDMHGSISSSFLPQSLMELNLRGNKFTGEIDFTGFPTDLVSINLSKNGFTGTAVLTPGPRWTRRVILQHQMRHFPK